MESVKITRALRRAVNNLAFAGDVSHVYNPLDYAWKPHVRYLELFGQGRRDVILMGMNPGPYGMAQTGVPFGEVEMVRSWLGIEEAVKRPAPEHPKRPIQGFECPRSEVSGRRLWSWARDRFQKPETFFSRFFIHNYCPLVFMSETGRNITPDKLSAAERQLLYAACDRALQQLVAAMQPSMVIGIGAFAETRAHAALPDSSIRIARLLHPSPASPIANRGWAEQADQTFQELGLEI